MSQQQGAIAAARPRIQQLPDSRLVARSHTSASRGKCFKPFAWGLISSLSAILPAEDAWAQIEGRVVDLFGKPVSAATVSIQGLRFRTQTNDNGEFRLEYVPGSMVVLVTKDGYLPEAGRGSVSLNLSTVTRVPIEDLALVLLPPANGLFLVGKTGYVLVPGHETVQEQSGTSAFDQRVVWSVQGPYVHVPDSLRQFSFALRGFELREVSEAQYKAVRVQGRGVVAEASRAPFGLQVAAQSMRADVVQDIPLFQFAEGIFGGSVGLPSDGLYAICEWRQFSVFDATRVPKVCYPITTGDAPPPGARATAAQPPARPSAYIAPSADTPVIEDFAATFVEVNGFHAGIDFEGPGKVVAIAAGMVALISPVARSGREQDFGFGNTVILEHNLKDGTKVYTLYAHLAAIDPALAVGKAIVAGTPLGEIGSSGNGKERYWRRHALGGTPHCVPSVMVDGRDYCPRLHFELKSKPVLENPEGGQVCTNTGWHHRKSSCYGYTPEDPRSFGYLDPWQIIRGELPVVKPGDTTASSSPGAAPAVPATTDPRERWDRFIASESQAVAKFPSARDWRGMVSLALTFRTDSYEALYLSAVNRRNLAADALVNVSEFVKKGDYESATTWAVSYSRINQESNNLFDAANQRLTGAAVDLGRDLEMGYQVLKHSSQIGFLAACGKKCYDVAGYVFLVTDYGVDYSMRGRDEAGRSFVADLAAQWILRQQGLAAWMDSRTAQLIGRSGLYSQLDALLRDPQRPAQIMKAVAAGGRHGVSELSEATVKEMVLAIRSAVARSRSLEPSDESSGTQPVAAPKAITPPPQPRTEEQTYVAEMKTDLRYLVVEMESFFADSAKYTAKVGPGGVNFTVTFAGNTPPRIALTADGWTAVIRNVNTRTTCAIFMGSTPQPPATEAGQPACQ